AAAYILSKFEFNRTIKFVTFSGEEVGLIGSRAYVKEIYENNEELLVELNADMIGYVETAQGGKNITLVPTKDAQWIVEDIKSVNENYDINFNINSGRIIDPRGARGGSDYFDFVLYGYEAIAFWESEWKRDFFHNPDDSIENMNFSYFVNVTKLIVGSLAHLADMVEINHPTLRIASPKRGRLYFEDRTLKILKYHRTIVFDDVLICTEVEPGDSPIEKVEFYYDGKLKFTDTERPYQWRINQRSLRKHTIKAIAYDEKGRTSSDEINFRFVNLMLKR
ncbi:MAG: M28 family peptidase, partial [Thermoplasmatales archaeon]